MCVKPNIYTMYLLKVELGDTRIGISASSIIQ